MVVVREFVIPLNLQDLCQATDLNQYVVIDTYSATEIREKVEAAKVALGEEGLEFILDHFTTFFSLLQKFNQISENVKQKAWNILTKAFNFLNNNLSIFLEDPSNIDSELQFKMCNITKMIVYSLFEIMKCYQNQIAGASMGVDGKGKKIKNKPVSEDGWDWNAQKHKIFVEVFNFLQLPLKLLWEPPVVDEEFVNLIANFLYKCLEDPQISAANMKYMRETIFQILGILIKQYLHGLSFCVKTIQLLKLNDHLVNSLSQGIVQLVNECGCSNIVKEIVREIASTDTDQLTLDTGGTRSINQFLVQLAEALPEAIIPVISQLMHHLDGDSYSMRMCVLGVIGEITLTVFTKESLDEKLKSMRDEFLDALEDHVHDVNAFVRSRTLQIWQKLCLAKAIPISRANQLLKLTTGRLNDKSSNVKKQAVILVKCLMEGNPYCSQLSSEEIAKQLENEKTKLASLNEKNKNSEHELNWKKIEKKLKKLLESLDDEDKEKEEEKLTGLNLEEFLEHIHKKLHDGFYREAILHLLNLKEGFQTELGTDLSEDTESLLKTLRQIYLHGSKTQHTDVDEEERQKILESEKAAKYLEDAHDFAVMIDNTLPLILTLLDSNVITDVLEAINFFTSAYLFGFEKALEGIRKMLPLIYSKETNIKNGVSSSYKELYFKSNATGRQHAVIAIKNLSNLIMKLNPGQLNALEEVVREWVKTDVLDKHCIQVIFERFSMKIPGTTEGQSWAALVLIRMMAAEESKMIKTNISVLLDQGFTNKGQSQFLHATETCKALRKLVPSKVSGVTDQMWRYQNDHEIFTTVYKLLRDGLWKLDDPYYVPFADEAINLVFALCFNPDAFCEQILYDLYERITTGKGPNVQKKKSGKALLKKQNANDIFDSEVSEENESETIQSPEAAEPFDPINTDLMVLTRFISLVGQIAGNYVIFLEGPVLDELKRRNQVEYERKVKKMNDTKRMNESRKGRHKSWIERSKTEKSSSSDSVLDGDKTVQENNSEDLEFNRIAADDDDSGEMKKQTEFEILSSDGLLGRFIPLIQAICSSPGKYCNVALQNSAIVTLAKYMQISSNFCEANLQLLVTICEKSNQPSMRQNAMIALGALQYRFPNTLEPWTPNMYAMLRDKDPNVRITSVIVLTDLIVNEMVKARGRISDLAESIVDNQIEIAQLARHFFREYGHKGNALYNVLPTIISNLTQADTALTEEQFQTVMRFILGQITKDKQVECLVEKLCQYFEAGSTERQWKDLAYCLSLLNYNDKGLRKILENMRYFANKLYIAEVYECFCTILTNASRNPQKEKTLIDEIQTLIDEYRNKSCDDRNIVFSAMKKKCPTTAKKKRMVRTATSSESDSELETRKPRKSTRCRKKISYDTSDDEAAFISDVSDKENKDKPNLDVNGEELDSDELPAKHKKVTKTNIVQKKKSKVSNSVSDDVSSGEEQPKKEARSLRSTRKRK